MNTATIHEPHAPAAVERPRPQARDPLADELAARVEAQRRAPGEWPARRSVAVSVLVAVRHEQANIVECLRRLDWANEIVVVDSDSKDQTVPLAQAMGADVYQFELSAAGWPKKRNWALEHLSWRNEWVLIMDADEHMTPELAAEIGSVVAGRRRPSDPRKAGCGDGYWINRRLIFMNRWIRGCGYYPSWNIRLFKHKVGRYERIGNLGHTQSGDIEIHEHVVLSTGRAGYLEHDFIHYAYPDLASWVEKHNRYTSWEAHVMLAGHGGQVRGQLLGSPIERRRWIKGAARGLPFRPTLRFIYGYFLRRGCLDGYPGYVICRLMAWYEFMSTAKMRELMLQSRAVPWTDSAPPPLSAPPARRSVAPAEPPDDLGQLVPESSPWTFGEKVRRAIWLLLGRPLFRLSFHNWYAFRAWLLRLFGARIGKGVRLRPTANIEIPWNLDIRDGVTVGDYAILYSLGTISIGERTIVSQYAHLCAGTHDHTDRRFPLIRDPIEIGPDAWIGADAFVGPNVRVGRLCVLGARSSAYRNLDDATVYVGNPARPLKKRELS